MAKNKGYVSITADEYEELIECKTKINLLIDCVLEMQKDHIANHGLGMVSYDADAVNAILGFGYINQNIKSYVKEYKQRIGGKTKCE